MFRKLNRIIQDFLRPKRLALGKAIWDKKKENTDLIIDNKIDMSKVRSILFLRYDGKIGDMVVNTLMFREVKRKYPGIKIDVVARGAAMDILKYNPYVDNIYGYKKGKNKDLIAEIKGKNYDVLVDFTEMLRVNQMEFINKCAAKVNIGLDKKDWKMFDLSIELGEDYDKADHITKRYGAYLKRLGIDSFEKKYDIYLADQEKYEEYDVVLNPYGASKHKHFNQDTLTYIIELLNKLGRKVILIYSPDKYEELDKFIKGNPHLKAELAVDIKGILDSAEIIKKSQLVITPDTSIVHIASAFDKKIISVYPPSGGTYGVDHLVWGPLRGKENMIFCQPANKKGEEININTFDKVQIKILIEKMFN